MVENKGYEPSLTEWDELVLLWNKSRMVLASTLAPNVRARIAWTAKQFADTHAQVPSRLVYAWLERNLEIAAGSVPAGSDVLAGTHWHEEPTAVHQRAARGTQYDHIKSFPVAKPVVARGPRGD